MAIWNSPLLYVTPYDVLKLFIIVTYVMYMSLWAREYTHKAAHIYPEEKEEEEDLDDIETYSASLKSPPFSSPPFPLLLSLTQQM